MKIRLALVALAILALSGTLVLAQDSFRLTIMHTNDTHSFHEADSSGNGGVARQATVVNQIRAAVPNTLLLDAGDRFAGTLYYTQYNIKDKINSKSCPCSAMMP